MKDLINKPENIQKFEFWASTTLYVFSLFFLIAPAVSNDWNYTNESQQLNYSYNYFLFSNLIESTTLYLTFLVANFRLVPQILARRSTAGHILLLVLLFGVLALVFIFTNTFLKYQLHGYTGVNAESHQHLVQHNVLYGVWLLMLFALYTVLKQVGLYLLNHAGAIQQRYPIINPEGLTALVLWMISLFFLAAANAGRVPVAAWAVLVPSAILFYWYAFHSLIPHALRRRKPFRFYLWRSFLVAAGAFFPITLIAMPLANDGEAGPSISLFNSFFQLLVTAPLTWLLFRRRMQGNEELYVLRKELRQSNASFDFLRSQINPHFLFNALNTIYGTAIQEKAERTSEGIEKLGDMMRFMLQENMQEKISLAREIDYLKNYIGLQRLRTDVSPGIQIVEAIDEQVLGMQIAPMLLIPFVENAFKHGISFREPSHIKILLEMRGNTLYFDVNNSRHERPDNDPEKNNNGIGLNNVKQRLQLLYPNRHELIIRETGKEFFIHLTMQLT